MRISEYCGSGDHGSSGPRIAIIRKMAGVPKSMIAKNLKSLSALPVAIRLPAEMELANLRIGLRSNSGREPNRQAFVDIAATFFSPCATSDNVRYVSFAFNFRLFFRALQLSCRNQLGCVRNGCGMCWRLCGLLS
jgi:hypothetical protein